MPNHVVNEIIARNIQPSAAEAIKAVVLNGEGRIDFELLVPAPKNIWWGSVSSNHEKAFRNTHLDWARENWGTKWNAYGSHDHWSYDGAALTLTFDTAWSPPYGWLAALFNTFELTFDHNWLDEGAIRGVEGVFDFTQMAMFAGNPWSERPASDEMQKHLHFLRWGVEEFPPEDDDVGAGNGTASTTDLSRVPGLDQTGDPL